MKIGNIDMVLTDYEGFPIMENYPDRGDPGPDGRPKIKERALTLHQAIGAAVAATFDDEQRGEPDAEDKWRRGKLADRIYGAGEEIELTNAEAVEIVQRINRAFPSVRIFTEIKKILDPDLKDPEMKIPKGK